MAQGVAALALRDVQAAVDSAALQWAVRPVVQVVAVAVVVAAARREPSGVVVPAVGADASPRSSAGKSSTRWRPPPLVVCGSERVMGRLCGCGAAHP